MFWGLILEPYKRYTQTVTKAFHVTNAALDATTGDTDVCQVMVGAQGKDFLICSLQKGKMLQTPLQLFFAEGSEISFTSSGKSIIHLTGFLEPEDMMDMDGDEDDESEEGEDESVSEEETVTTKAANKKDKKRKPDSSPEENGLAKKMKRDLVAKFGKPVKDDDSDSEVDKNLLKLLEDDEDTDENDDTFVPNDTNDTSMADSDDDDDDEDDDDDDDDDDEDDDDEDAESEEEPAKVSKKQAQSDKKQKNKEKPQQNGVQDKKAKANKENEQKQNKQAEKTQPEKRVLNGNVAVEDLKVGQGQVAKSGSTVQVYYEGRLKNNNKMFDSCQKGNPFKFKLGKQEVIQGWDIGIVGMKVGGKRRIVIPPGMGYGKKGSPPVIPPNSTLVFEVELKNVN